nr:hypothetical protein [Burkholderia cenocepacia]
MDETLTHRGRLAAQTYAALERLQARGIRVIPVTAAPAGWCDQMARMWPVDGVIAENGGLFIRRSPDGHGAERRYWHADDALDGAPTRSGASRSMSRRPSRPPAARTTRTSG